MPKHCRIADYPSDIRSPNTMPKLSSKELFLACLSNPSVVRSRLEKNDVNGKPATAIKGGEGRKSTASEQSTAPLSSSLHSSLSTLEYGEVVHFCSSSPTKTTLQEGLPVHPSSESVTSDRSMSPTKAAHRSNSMASVKPLPPRTLAQARWSSSRSMKDTSPDEPSVNRVNPHVLLKDKSPRSPLKSPRRGAASMQQHSATMKSSRSLNKSSHTAKIEPSLKLNSQHTLVQVEWSSSRSIMEGIEGRMLEVDDFDTHSFSSVSSSDSACQEHAQDPLTTIRLVSSRRILDVEDDDDASIQLDIEPTRSPRRSIIKRTESERFSKTNQDVEMTPLKRLSQSVANFHVSMALAERAPEETTGDAAQPSFQANTPAHNFLLAIGNTTPESPSKASAKPKAVAAPQIVPTLRPRTDYLEAMAEARWDSSRSLYNLGALDASAHGSQKQDVAPRSPRKAPVQVLESNAATIQSLPPTTVALGILAATRWDSSWSLNSKASKTSQVADAATHKDILKKALSVHALLTSTAPSMPMKTVVLTTTPTQALPPTTVPLCMLAEARWESSRSLNSIISMTSQGADTAPRSPRKASFQKAKSVQTLMVSSALGKPSTVAVPTAAPTQTLPPTTLPLGMLAETRWDSSRSLHSNASKSSQVADTAPWSPRKAASQKSLSVQTLLTSTAPSMPMKTVVLTAAPTQALPPTTVPLCMLAEARWDSSRSLNIISSMTSQGADTAPRSPRKASFQKAKSVQTLMVSSALGKPSTVAVPTAAPTQTLPPTTVPLGMLAETRWDSSRSLNSNASKSSQVADTAPRSHRKAASQKSLSVQTLLAGMDSAPKTPVKAVTRIPTIVAPLPLTTLFTRWDSSRSLKDAPPQVPPEDESLADTIDTMEPCKNKAVALDSVSGQAMQSFSVGTLSPTNKALPPKTVHRSALTVPRCYSLRPPKDSPPKTSCENVSEVIPMTSRSPRKAMLTQKAASARLVDSNSPSRGTLPPAASVANVGVLRSDALSELRWESSRSLKKDAPPKTPVSPRKKPQDTPARVQKQTIASLSGHSKETTQPVVLNPKSILTRFSKIPSAIAASPSNQSRKSSKSKTEENGGSNRTAQRRRLSLLKSASASSKKKNCAKKKSLKDVLEEYAKIIGDFSKKGD